MDYFKKLKDRLINRGNKKNMQDLVIILIFGIIIVIASNFFFPPAKVSSGYVEVNTNSGSASNSQSQYTSYEDSLESELTEVLRQIEGAGKVKVMIYYDSGNESVPAYNENDTTKVTEENDSSGGKRVTSENSNSSTVVTTNDGSGNKPFIIKEVKPKISGVIVIAEGADNPEVKYKLYEAVKTIFNVDQYKVNVYPMQKNK